MNPFYLGTSSRRVFAIHEPPLRPSPRLRSAVLCYPWGSEYVYAHRSLRLLAQRLAAAGIHTLRFDYYGTGDSDGDMSQADLGGWEADTEAAIEGLQDMIGCAQVTLIGMRLGGAVAARVAMRLRRKVDAVVLWDPVVSGEEYIQTLERLGRPSMDGDAGKIEVLGYPLTASMRSAIRRIDLREYVATPPARTLMLASETLASHASLRGTARSAGAKPFDLEPVAAPLPWVESVTVTGAVPVRVLQRVTEWLA